MLRHFVCDFLANQTDQAHRLVEVIFLSSGGGEAQPLHDDHTSVHAQLLGHVDVVYVNAVDGVGIHGAHVGTTSFFVNCALQAAALTTARRTRCGLHRATDLKFSTSCLALARILDA
jgi:hypothetical protein